MSDEAYKKMTGSSIEDLRARIKKHVEEARRGTAGCGRE